MAFEFEFWDFLAHTLVLWPKGFSSILLKEIFPIITNPLCHVFNLSLQTGYIPDSFKIAKVVPIYKSGDSQQFTNYRPISLLSSFSKLLEKVVYRQMEGFLRVNNILYSHQYGFRRGHNTSHPVLHFLNNIYIINRSIMPTDAQRRKNIQRKSTLGCFNLFWMWFLEEQ